jgi:hypothetical protein
MMLLKQPFKKTSGRFGISAILKKYIYHFTILINSTP